MNTLIKLLLILAVFFVTTPLFAGCGACGGHAATEVKSADCGTTSCDSKAPKVTGDDCSSGVCGTSEPEPAKLKSSSKPHDHGHANIGTISPLALKSMVDAKLPVTILDARSGKWDDGRRIPGAKSLNADSKVREILKVLPDKESLVVTYCSNLQCPASAKLAKHLKSLGYKNVVEFPEGIQGWSESGFPVHKVK